MFKLVEWSPELDLTEFYSEAERRKHVNNSSRKVMVDCFRNEERSQVWILYKDNIAIGSVAAHTFPEMGPNAYRILARTCILDGAIPTNGGGLGLRSRQGIQQHQNVTCQFYVPKMIEWCGIESDMYTTSNQLDAGSQRKVHNIYFPLLERQGEFVKAQELHYRGVDQTAWKLNSHIFLENLNRMPRWNLSS